MTGRRRERARLASVALCVAIAAHAVAAIAAGGAKLKTSSASTTIESNESGSATAKCKKGTKAIAGGYESPSDVPTGQGSEGHESRRAGARGWIASAFNAGQGSRLTAFAYCRDEAIKVASAEVAIAADEGGIDPALPTGTAVAKCPRGTKIASGGFDNPDFAYHGGYSATNIRPYESRKAGKRKWTVSASNRSDTAGTLVAYAYCHKGKPLKTKQASEPLPLGPGDFPLGSATASCKKSQRAVSGGYSSAQPADFKGPFFHESRRKGKRKWVVTAGANELGPTITAYVYCEKK